VRWRWHNASAKPGQEKAKPEHNLLTRKYHFPPFAS